MAERSRHYGRNVVTKLDAAKFAYLIKAKEERHESCSYIALQLGINCPCPPECPKKADKGIR